MTALGQKIKGLILPPRPDPAQSRRIAEGRLIVSGVVALLLVGAIGARIVSLADANASLPIAQHNKAKTVERGRILDRAGRLVAGNLPDHPASLACRPKRNYECR